MWIRTQNKETLLNANCIDMYNLNKYEWIIEACGNDLGTYKSKERAIEVLDEIQRLIEDLKYMEYAIDKNKFCGYRSNVYQMPEE